jgi:hypothetical protein
MLVGEHRTQFGLDHVAPVGCHHALPGIDVHAQETDAGAGRRGPEPHADRVTAMQAAADAGELGGQRVLPGRNTCAVIRQHDDLRCG